jgi:LETM1 and EF-hand domain-containing protein 1
MIRDEGVNSLTVDELQSALRARGMRGTSNSKFFLRKKLNEWLDLSLNHNLPESILILSRAFVITENESAQDALKETISSLPDDLVEEIKLKVEHHAVSRDERLETIEHQNELIAEEIEEKQEQIKSTPKAAELSNEEKLKKDITEAVTVLASASPVEKERSVVKELRAEREKKKAEEIEKNKIAEQAPAAAKTEAEKKVAPTPAPVPEVAQPAVKKEENVKKGLESRLDRLVQQLEQEIEQVEQVSGNELLAFLTVSIGCWN